MKMCKHERLRAVGDRITCIDCGQELDLEFLLKKDEKPAEETPVKPRKRTAKKAV